MFATNRWFGLVMGAMFVALGVFVLLQPPQGLEDNSTMSTLFGGIMIVYGVFRGSRAFWARRR